eukprot:Phypoly_transcript_10796.p1 GENE.Phypoly_transcript_10796~~Phypoly_transcript_10796.p1  ORF type:complete len:409 (+),score=33.80 Phypoly_transcript_10796:180-1229(+)
MSQADILETMALPFYKLELAIRESAKSLPLLPALKNGQLAQGIAYSTRLLPTSMGHRVSRLLREFFTRIEKSSHHSIRKGYAQRYIWNAAVRNGGLLPAGIMRALADIVGWAISSVKTIWTAYVQAVVRNITPTNSMGDLFNGMRALLLALEESGSEIFSDTLATLLSAMEADEYSEVLLCVVSALWSWKKFGSEVQIKNHLTKYPHLTNLLPFVNWLNGRLSGHIDIFDICAEKSCTFTHEPSVYGEMVDHFYKEHAKLEIYHCSLCRHVCAKPGKLLEHFRCCHCTSKCLTCGGEYTGHATTFRKHVKRCGQREEKDKKAAVAEQEKRRAKRKSSSLSNTLRALNLE